MVDNRQFIITNKNIVYKDFQRKAINNYWLLYQPNLRIQEQEDKDGVMWYLLGQSYCADSIDKRPTDDIRLSHTDEIPSHYFFWAGKWTLIGNNQVHIDCVGINANFYYERQGLWFISPSMNVLVNCNRKTFGEYQNTLIRNGSFDWFPAPLTKIADVYRMVTSQILHITDKGLKIVNREVLSFDSMALTDDEKVEQLCKLISNVVHNINTYSGKQVWLALTGGGDSRAILATLLNQNIPFQTYIMGHKLISKGDKTIPVKLAKAYGFKHKYISTKEKFNQEKVNEFEEHTFCNLNDANRLFYAYSQFNEIPNDVVALKGAIFEIGEGFYYDTLLNPINVRHDLYKAFPDLESFDRYKKSLDLWFDWVEAHPNSMDLRDRLYMEERNGGWIANLEQALDLIGPESIHPANCGAIVSLFTCMSYATKKCGNVNQLIIKKLCPHLLDEPINPKDRIRMLKYYLKKFWNQPITTTKKGIRKIKKIITSDQSINTYNQC